MVYRTTLAPVVSMRREMDRLFEDVFGRATGPAAPAMHASVWHPATDVRETAEGYVFELELPGVEPSAVEVTAENGLLTVRGEKRSSRQEGDAGTWHVVERTAGAFTRVFRLPQLANEEKIEASFSNGILSITVGKVELPKPRKIDVRVN